MKIANCCINYFNGFKEISNYEKNNAVTNVLAILKIFSYLTFVIPLSFAALYIAASLYGRVTKKQQLSPQETIINNLAKKQLQTNNSTIQSKITQTLDSITLRAHTGDLTLSQKMNLKINLIDENTIEFRLRQVPDVSVTIRRQDIFNSQAQVIINAANYSLDQGGGIDGAIRQKGGPEYQAAHRDLQTQYNAHYVSGHAAMIESGALRQNHNIDNVIVIAGPLGATTPQKEDNLYSCYYNSLMLAENQNKISIAFPSISTGIFGFPKHRAASISLKAIYDFIDNHPNTTLKNISIHFYPGSPQADLEMYKTAAVVDMRCHLA